MKKKLPDWVGRLPFLPENKIPAIIRPEMEVSTIYGTGKQRIRVQKYVSTDKITCGDFQVPPGGFFDPPDVHPGDEFYYLFQGTAVVFNPQTGETHTVNEKEGFLIPGGVWHQVYNFSETNVTILGTIAPAIWSEEDSGSEIEYLEKSNFYTPGESPLPRLPRSEPLVSTSGMTSISADRQYHVLLGNESHALLSLLVNTERMQTGILTMAGNSFTTPEIHVGDELIYALEDSMVVKILEQHKNDRSVSARSLEIQKGGKCLIPGGYLHEYYNFNEQPVKALISIAPNPETTERRVG